MIFGSLRSSFRGLSKDYLEVKFRGLYKSPEGKLSSSQISCVHRRRRGYIDIIGQVLQRHPSSTTSSNVILSIPG